MSPSPENLARAFDAETVRVWTLDHVPVAQRPSAWRRAIGEALQGFAQFGADELAGFEGRIEQAALPGLALCHLHSSAQHLHLAGTHPQQVLLACDSRHDWQLASDTATQDVRIGDVVLLPGDITAVLRFPHGLAGTLVLADSAWVRHWLPAFDAVTVVARDGGWGRVLSTTLCELQADFEMGLQMRRESLMDLLGSLLAGSIAPHQRLALKLDLVEQARRLCLQRLADSELGVRQVAADLGVSVRTLERAFAGHGTTFVETVRHLRLDRAAALLEQPGFGDIAVGKVGASCGFPSPSHFVREFHRRWGVTPGQWRHRATALRSQAARVADADRMIDDARQHLEAQRLTVSRLAGGSPLLLAQANELLRQMERTVSAFEAHRDLLAQRVPSTPPMEDDADAD